MQRKAEIDMFNDAKEYDFFEFKLELIEMADHYWIHWNSKTTNDIWNDNEYLQSISYELNENNKF